MVLVGVGDLEIEAGTSVEEASMLLATTGLTMVVAFRVPGHGGVLGS